MNKELGIMIILTIGVIAYPSNIGAAGIEVTPEKFEVKSKLEQNHTSRLVVTNPFSQNQQFKIYADNYRDVISVEPENFTLTPGERKEIAVIFTPTYASLGSSRKVSTDISVVATPENTGNLKTSVGVKVPVDIVISRTRNDGNWFEWMIYTIVFLGSLMLWSLRPKSK